MKVIDLLGERFGTDAYYRRAAPAWARRHLPDTDESIAGTVAEVVATALGVGLNQLKGDTDLVFDVGCNEAVEWQEIQMALEKRWGAYWGTNPRFKRRSLGELVAFVSQNRPHLCMEPSRNSLEDWCLTGALEASETLTW